jgi:hypothetical protein
MRWAGVLTLFLAAPSSAVVRFHCSQLVVERLDPLVNPGSIPSSHVHQIVGGVSKAPHPAWFPMCLRPNTCHIERLQRHYGS